MSVILECQPGDTFVCIEQFHGYPDGVRCPGDSKRAFEIGERLKFVSFRRHKNLADHPSGWLVVFEAADGKHYAATQTYFVTEDCWLGIERHLLERRRRASKRAVSSGDLAQKSVKKVIQAKKPFLKKRKAG